MHIDLNLLTALDALLEEGSVSGAAKRLHLSQPAMSRTLARIRLATADPILVRAGHSMVASPRALAVRSELIEIVRRSRALLSPSTALDLPRLERTFTIRCHDALLPSLGAALVTAVQKAAPSVSIRFLAESSGDSEERVDLDIGSPKPVTLGLSSETLASDVLVVVMRADHSFAKGALTLKRYAAAHHVVVSRRGRLRDPIDVALEAAGARRRVVVSAPTTTAALHWVKECNLVAAIASRSAPRGTELVTRKLPFATSPLPIVQSWRPSLDGDPGHQWLRALCRETVTSKQKQRVFG